MFPQIYPGILILAVFYIVPIYSTDECSTNCTLKNGKSPPEMKFKMRRKTATLKSTIALNCRLCHSNPPSTIHWFFNGKALNFQAKRMHLLNQISSCQQTLYLLTVLNEDEGNYTCVARNKFGEANSTTEITIFGKDCSSECVLTEDGKLKVGNNRLGPPKMKVVELNQYNVATKQMVEISCTLCESNPPSTLTWYYNGNELDPKKNNIQVISRFCRESLYFRAVQNAAGNYTCMAKNVLGKAYSTTKLKVYDSKLPRPKMIVNLEARAGTVRGEKIKIGSQINITCSVDYPNCTLLSWSWTKDYQLITQNLSQYRQENSRNQCMRKLIIHEVTAANKADYRCNVIVWREGLPPTDVIHGVLLRPVPCFQGFYCPPTVQGAQRCPNGTFTMQENATNLKQCQPCPNKAKQNETWTTLQDDYPDAANIFETNCLYYQETSDENSGLSRGVISAIAVSLSALVILGVLVILYAVRNCRNYKRLIQRPAKEIPIEIPDVPQSKDVFVCYSSKNREWVHGTLFANLRAQDFETFIDFKDFEIGLPIHQNIVNGIYGSRRTIFVRSKDSLKSFYARTELNQALAAERQTRHQVIVILYEKCEVPKEISDIVYLDWTDEKNRDIFWRKLYDALRKPLENEVEV